MGNHKVSRCQRARSAMSDIGDIDASVVAVNNEQTVSVFYLKTCVTVYNFRIPRFLKGGMPIFRTDIYKLIGEQFFQTKSI